MTTPSSTVRVAVVGAGLSGIACAASLHQGGLSVSLFDKSRGVGGRMATRRLPEIADIAEGTLALDHGATLFGARTPRFRAVLARAEAAGAVARWTPRVHSQWPGTGPAMVWTATPDMPALARHLRADLPLHLQHTVQRLQRTAAGWLLHMAEGSQAGPFDQVVLALPPAQAAALLGGHHEGWAETLRQVHMQPCWTLMAASADVDWPWDAAEPGRGPLAWVVRDDRKPGREVPAGTATWVAQASAEWSAAHLEDSPESVTRALCEALAELLPDRSAAGTAAGTAGGTGSASRRRAPKWLHATVHRWRYALPAVATPAQSGPGPNKLSAQLAPECWWDAHLGLGVCGDFLAGADVEAAWRSGDELADTLAAGVDSQTALAA